MIAHSRSDSAIISYIERGDFYVWAENLIVRESLPRKNNKPCYYHWFAAKLSTAQRRRLYCMGRSRQYFVPRLASGRSRW